NVIEQNNLDYYDVVDYLNNKNSFEYSSFKNFIFTELNKLLNYKLDNISILNDLVFKNNNNQFSLEIIPNSNYFFLSNSKYFDSGKIVISNLQFSEYIKFSSINFDDFYKNLQNLITQNELTQTQFSSLFNENNFKEYVSKNLYKSNNDLLNFDAINTVTYSDVNNAITITPNKDAKFKLLATSNYNINVDNNGNIIISDLNFYTNIKFVKLDSLFNALNKEILDNNWSLDDFVGQVLNNPNSIIKIIAKNLFISDTDTITESDIKSITYLNNALNITLNPPTNFNKYIAEDNKNISFSNNTFIIKNLSFVTNINFVKLDKLFDLFQNQISNNKYTIEQFKEWIANNTNINGDVANNLYISENDTINSDLVESVKFNGVDSVIVSLKKSSLINYSIGKNDDISLVDNKITITNFIYYSVTNVVNLSAVFD
ncbi:MAG: hypothetical protein K2L64_01700, partial [Ureaplasma sp.]|nr:hypothetical protein [Ureaplasma sp.]